MNHNPDIPPLAVVMQRFAACDPALVHLDEKEAAACLGQRPKTLEAWRRTGRELPFIKLGRSIRYRLSDVLACVERNTYSTSREAMSRDRTIPPQRRPRGRAETKNVRRTSVA